jgi:hypothetical protein
MWFLNLRGGRGFGDCGDEAGVADPSGLGMQLELALSNGAIGGNATEV